MINPDRHPPDDWDPDREGSGMRLPFFALPLILCALVFDIYITWVVREICFWGTLSAGLILLSSVLVRLLLQHQRR